MRISFKHIGLVFMAFSLGACADSGFDANAFYGDLSEAEQVEYMAEVVAVLNTETEKHLLILKSIIMAIQSGT